MSEGFSQLHHCSALKSKETSEIDSRKEFDGVVCGVVAKALDN